MNGNFVYDDTILDSNPSLSTGRYNGAVQSMNLNFGSGAYLGTLGTAGSNFITIETFGNSTIQDQYVMRAPLAGNLLVGSNLSPLNVRMEITHVDFLGSLSGSDALVPPTFGNFLSGDPILRVSFENDGTISQFVVAMQTISSAVVPLPPAVILFGAGLVALIGLGARNWQQKGNNLA